MKRLPIFIIAILSTVFTVACSDDKNEIAAGFDPTHGTGTVPEVVSIVPMNDAVQLDTIDSIIVTYNIPIVATPEHSVKVNDTYADSVHVDGEKLIIFVDTKPNTAYTITIKSPTVHNGTFAFARDYQFAFSTRIYNNFDASVFNINENPVNTDATEETKALYKLLLSQFGKVTFSATMSDKNGWSLDMAEKLYEISGKYPAIHGFDFMHMRWCPPFRNSDWVDISNLDVIKNWAAAGGIVTMAWHWNVPKTEADINNINNYAFYYENGANTFSIRQALKNGTWQNKQINADLDVVAQRFLELQTAGIPVLWRPLHEASGAWFWWGAEGAVQYKKLWVYIYNYLKNKGVNNLLWVWTSEGTQIEDARWYPGDEYVDIIGTDNYKVENHGSLQKEFKQLIDITGGKKIITLSECGAIPSVEEMLDKGDVWSWFMPWNGEYMTDAHNSAEFFKNQMKSEYVITRDELEGLK